jgi:hypothetical protein
MNWNYLVGLIPGEGEGSSGFYSSPPGSKLKEIL